METPASISARTVTLEQIASILEADGLKPDWFGPRGVEDGWLAVMWERAYTTIELSELVEDIDPSDPSDEWRYMILSASDEVRASADRRSIGRFIRRVNRRLRVIRASFDGKQVVFDYTAILTGGEMPARWVVGCIALFDNVIRMAREQHDTDRVLDW